MQSEDGKTTERLNPPVDSLVIVAPPIGQWTVTASNSEGEKALMGFSVNPPLSEMSYAPMEGQRLRRAVRQEGLQPRNRRREA